MDLGVGASDERRIDLVVCGFPLYGGLPVFGDATMASPLHANGQPWARAADEDGVALRRTRRKHEQTYPEVVRGDRGRLVVLGCEVCGRWEPAALKILGALAATKAREAPSLLRRSVQMAWRRRWLGMLSIAAQTALAESLLRPDGRNRTELDGAMPLISELLGDRH